MAHPIPTRELIRATAGDWWTWTKNLPNYLPADGWTLTYTLLNSKSRYTIAAADNGDGTHLLDWPATTTAAFVANEYTMIGDVSMGVERYEVYRGAFEVIPDTLTSVDLRSHARKTLQALEATIEGRATHDQLAISIRGRSISRMTADELTGWRDEYRAECAAEQAAELAAAGRGRNNKVVIRF